MKIQETGFRDLLEVHPIFRHDNRGYFLELFRNDTITEITGFSFVQYNYSFSRKGVLRGFHFQKPPFVQAKLAIVLSGKVLDIVVDMRRDSETFGRHYKCLLDGEKMNMLFVPKGFAHGFLALEDSRFLYKCSEYYNQQADSGFIWNDTKLGIEWPGEEFILSEKDRKLSDFETALKGL